MLEIGVRLLNLGEARKAVIVLTHALNFYDLESNYGHLPYEYRSKAHAKLGNFKKAMDDLHSIYQLDYVHVDDWDVRGYNRLQRDYYMKYLAENPSEYVSESIPWIENNNGSIAYPHDISSGMDHDNAQAILKAKYSEIIDRYASDKDAHWDMVGSSDGNLSFTLRIIYDRFKVGTIDLHVQAPDTPENKEKLKTKYLETAKRFQKILPFNSAEDKPIGDRILFVNHQRGGPKSEAIILSYEVSDNRVIFQSKLTYTDKEE